MSYCHRRVLANANQVYYTHKQLRLAVCNHSAVTALIFQYWHKEMNTAQIKQRVVQTRHNQGGCGKPLCGCTARH
jgi:hypothetical protein